jgi:hypothetical protein
MPMPPAPNRWSCPRCQFTYAWDGDFCGHCHFPYPSRANWANFRELARFAAAHPDATDSQLLRIAVGCIRRAWHLLTDPAYRQVVITAERIVEGRANYADLALAADPIETDAIVRSSSMTPAELASASAHEAIRSAVYLMSLPGGGRLSDAVFAAARHIREAVALERVPVRPRREFPVPPALEPYRTVLAVRPFDARELRQLRRERPDEYRAYTTWSARIEEEDVRRSAAARAEEAVQCDLYRDVVGYPFEPARLDLSPWRTDVVTSLAESIFSEQAFDRLPVLADALEDAGCEDCEILNHCRADRPHVRGCWVVELCRPGPDGSARFELPS